MLNLVQNIFSNLAKLFGIKPHRRRHTAIARFNVQFRFIAPFTTLAILQYQAGNISSAGFE